MNGFGGDVFAFENVAKENVVVHGVGNDLGDFGVGEFDKGVVFGFTGLRFFFFFLKCEFEISFRACYKKLNDLPFCYETISIS